MEGTGLLGYSEWDWTSMDRRRGIGSGFSVQVGQSHTASSCPSGLPPSYIPPQEAETRRYTSAHFQSQWCHMKNWRTLVTHYMNHYSRCGLPGAKTQSKKPLSKLCLSIAGWPFFWPALCVKEGYVLHLLEMEERNSSLKYFQDMRASNDALLYQLPSLIILYQLFYLRGIWSSPISDVQGDGTSSSSYVTVPEGSTIVGPGGAWWVSMDTKECMTMF